MQKQLKLITDMGNEATMMKNRHLLPFNTIDDIESKLESLKAFHKARKSATISRLDDLGIKHEDVGEYHLKIDLNDLPEGMEISDVFLPKSDVENFYNQIGIINEQETIN